MTDTTQEGLTEDELAVLQESSAQRSDESATDWAARARQEADAARAKAQDRSNEETAGPAPTEGVEGVTPEAPQDDAPASPEVQTGDRMSGLAEQLNASLGTCENLDHDSKPQEWHERNASCVDWHPGVDR